ncbi:hypothetical protein [Thermocatellispora tengchongensis]|uniref:hypothetical protein n=1 Tax=Thermocatellispora tengchongensis TaxID=1073253 RepID=UPI00362DCF5F
MATGEQSWTPSRELAREPYELLGALIDATAERRDGGMPRHTAGALLWRTYAYWHTLPMALGWALNRRVPIMRFGDTVFRLSDAGVTVAAVAVTTAVLPGDPHAGEPGTAVVPDLGAVIREALLDGQGPLVSAIARLTGVDERALWGSTAEALAHPLATLAGVLPGEPATTIPELLAAVGRPVAGLLAFTGATYRRVTCCLSRGGAEGDACASCRLSRGGAEGDACASCLSRGGVDGACASCRLSRGEPADVCASCRLAGNPF